MTLEEIRAELTTEMSDEQVIELDKVTDVLADLLIETYLLKYSPYDEVKSGSLHQGIIR